MDSRNNRYKGYFKDHYDASFSKKDIERETRWFSSQWNYINSKIEIVGESTILEVGSGLGGIYKFVNNKENYTGIELDPEAVDFTNNYFGTNCFLNTSLEGFSSSKKFNYIFAIEVLEHFCRPIENIEKIFSLMIEDGIFVGTSPYPFRKNVLADQTHNFVLHPENWKKLFLNVGFEKVSLFPMSFIPFLWRKNKKLNPILPFYCPWPKIISTCLIIAKKKP